MLSDLRRYNGRCLLLSPHLDDIELGCGGLASHLIESGADVRVVSFSFSEESLPVDFKKHDILEEANIARQTLGLSPSRNIFLDYKTRHFPSSRQEILDELINIKSSFLPDLVLLPSTNDCHQDHSVISEEGCRAFRSAVKLGYQLPWNCRTLENNFKIKIDEKHWLRKISAIECYRSQLVKGTFSLGMINKIGLVTGDGEYAESFEYIGSTNAQ